jgi:hypothetical protein
MDNKIVIPKEEVRTLHQKSRKAEQRKDAIVMSGKNTAFEDKRTKRNRTRQTQNRNAIQESKES